MGDEIRADVRPIKAGWAAHSLDLPMAAHGRTPELALANLQRAIELFRAAERRAQEGADGR